MEITSITPGSSNLDPAPPPVGRDMPADLKKDMLYAQMNLGHRLKIKWRVINQNLCSQNRKQFSKFTAGFHPRTCVHRFPFFFILIPRHQIFRHQVQYRLTTPRRLLTVTKSPFPGSEGFVANQISRRENRSFPTNFTIVLELLLFCLTC